jgi:hypothetical protein
MVEPIQKKAKTEETAEDGKGPPTTFEVGRYGSPAWPG